MVRRARWWWLLLLLAACAKQPVHNEVTIEMSRETDAVVVTAETAFDLKPGDAAAAAKAGSARDAAEAGTDEWSVRFARLEPEAERLTLDRSRGVLERVTHSARIEPEDLQLLFADTSITVHVLRGDGWRELAFYCGSSSRGSREQEHRFDEDLDLWSRAVARYFGALDRLYAYLDEQPGRARWVFAALLDERREDGSEPLVLEEEQPLVDDTLDAMMEIAGSLDLQEDRGMTFAQTADLLFNPFPARIVVRLPGDVLASQGFAQQGDAQVIEPVDLLESVAKLEGRWVEPDPLVAILREKVPTAEALAALPRRSRPVTSSSEIAQAIRDELVRPRSYVVRWRD